MLIYLVNSEKVRYSDIYKFDINGDDYEPLGTPALAAFICLITESAESGVIYLNAETVRTDKRFDEVEDYSGCIDAF